MTAWKVGDRVGGSWLGAHDGELIPHMAEMDPEESSETDHMLLRRYLPVVQGGTVPDVP